MDDPQPLSVTRVGAVHPDRDWIGLMRSALDRWEAVTPATPTSSVLGSGAVAAAEAAFSRVVGGRPALLLPSATYALRAGLQVLGVRAGDEVLCAAIDWPAGFAAATSLGAVPVGVAADPATLTVDPAAAAKARTEPDASCHRMPPARRLRRHSGLAQPAARRRDPGGRRAGVRLRPRRPRPAAWGTWPS